MILRKCEVLGEPSFWLLFYMGVKLGLQKEGGECSRTGCSDI